MTALYRAFGRDGRLLYVGMTEDVEKRIMQHQHDGALWVTKFESLSVEYYPTRRAARIAEIQAIRSEWPLYNIDHSIDPWSTKQLNWLNSQQQMARWRSLPPSPEESEAHFQESLAEARRIRQAVREARFSMPHVTSQQ